jgi:uncharacterized protein YnzC (UPF0291/DUF896 family)
MDIKELLDRINALYKKQVSEGLTEEEKVEQAELRKLYIKNFRNNFKAQLDSIKVVDKNDNMKPENKKIIH